MANKELKSIKFPGLADTYTVNSMPDGASANQQLATDKDGVMKWEEKPFYQFQDTEIIAWDGDTTGREEVPFGNGTSFWKISDTIYPPDGIVRSTFTIMTNGVPEDIVITDEMFQDHSSEVPGEWLVFYKSSPVLASTGSSGGLYFIKTDTFYVSSLSLIKTTLKEIDPVYIPEIPVEKLPEIPAEKLPEIPAEKLPAVQKTFEGSFDKVTEGRDTFVFNAFHYYKISEFSPRREDVISFSGTQENGDVHSTINEGENCCQYGSFIAAYQAGQCKLVVEGATTSYSFNAHSSGLYACYLSGNINITAGTYNFTCRLVRNIIQSPTTFKRYYLDVDGSGTLTVTEV